MRCKLEKNGREINIVLRNLEMDDVEKLPSLFRKVYKDNYAFEEVYSPNWWKNQINNRNIKVKVFSREDNSQVIGVFVLCKELSHNRLRIEKTLIDPAYQKLGIISFFAPYVLPEILKENEDVKYAEVRTSNLITQKTTYSAGMNPVGFFPNKLSTSEGRETSLLMVHSNLNKRRKKPNIYPPLGELYNFISRMFNLKDSYELLENKRSERKNSEITLKIIRKSKYCEIELSSPYSQSIIKLIGNDLIDSLGKCGIDTFCTLASAYNEDEQKEWLSLGFTAVGYVPAWKYVNEDEREDVIIMCKTKDNSWKKRLKLIRPAEELLSTITFSL